MAHVTKVSTASIDAVSGAKIPAISGLLAGENLDAVAPCYIGADGSVFMAKSGSSIGIIATGSQVHYAGFTADSVLSGEPVSLFGKGSRFNYGSGLTPGKLLFSGSVAGTLSDTQVLSGDIAPLAMVISATDIVVIK